MVRRFRSNTACQVMLHARHLTVALVLTVLVPGLCAARGGHSSGGSHRSHGPGSHSGAKHAGKAGTTPADRSGPASTPHRSAAAKGAFKRAHPCPSTGRQTGACPGYVVDHVVPLACGGSDAPANMQWQTTAAAKAKDKVERKGC